MIKSSAKIFTETKEKVRGGKGSMAIRYIIREDESFTGNIKTLARVTLEPGSSIGQHPHEATEEIYYILKGRALFMDNGVQKELLPGDVTLTGGGGTHSIEAIGEEPLEFMAVIAG